MVAYFETSGTPEQWTFVIWTIINRLNSSVFSGTIEELLVSNQYHISLRDPDSEGIYRFGIFAWYRDPNRGGVLSGQELSDTAYGYYSSLPQYSDLETVMGLVHGVIDVYNDAGLDPTSGAVYFANCPDVNWANTARANLERQADIDGLDNDLSVTVYGKVDTTWIVLNNIYDPPFGKYPFSGGYCTAYAISLCQIYLEN